MAPLQRASLDHVEQLGPAAALTGPAVRGDAGTIRRNLERSAAASPRARPLVRGDGQSDARSRRRSGRLTTRLASRGRGSARRMELIRGADELQRTTTSWRATRPRATTPAAPRMRRWGWSRPWARCTRGTLADQARARPRPTRVVVSIFVNPAQFGPGEDLRTLSARRGTRPRRLPTTRRRRGLGSFRGEVYPPGVELPEPGPRTRRGNLRRRGTARSFRAAC